MSNPRVPFQMSSERAKLAPLKGKSIIVHIVVNVEYWPFDQPMPRKVLSTPHGEQAMRRAVSNWFLPIKIIFILLRFFFFSSDQVGFDQCFFEK